MKHLFPFLLILISFNSLSQSFVQDNKQWNVIIEAFGPGGISSATEIFYTSGDTIINDENYTRIFRSGDSLLSSYYHGALRQVENQVFYMNSDGVEGLLYDFNLNEGDSTYIVTDFTYGEQELLVIVDSVDFVEINGEQKKRMFIVEEDWEPVNEEYWIEDIGSNCGPLYTFIHNHIICPLWQLSCCYENGEQIYQHENLECYANNVGIEEIEKSQVIISPNPIKQGGGLSVKLADNSQITRIEFIDLTGKVILKKAVNLGQEQSIQLNELQKGNYLLKVYSSNKQEYITKLMIN